MVAIVWFRNDLRLTDHPALTAAIETGQPILPLYIWDETVSRPLGRAAKWWLHHSLVSLKESLYKNGSDLICKQGSALQIFKNISKEIKIKHIFWHHRYDQEGIQQDQLIESYFKDQDIVCESFNGTLLFELPSIKNKQRTPFKIFSPFWKHCSQYQTVSKPLSQIHSIPFDQNLKIKSDDLESWNLLPTHPNWAESFETVWKPGEEGAQKLLKKFLKDKVQIYAEKRSQPAALVASDLSPYIRWGNISIKQLWHAVSQSAVSKECEQSGDRFLTELGWRDFCYYTLLHNPNVATDPMRPKFDHFPWQENDQLFKAWSKGLTGYPIVDAGMRQLWKIGYMHNRVRMITASFLIKHLLQPWQKGEQWFWDTLVDADLANNAFNWQWVAGCGIDSSPFFRVFNPIEQSKKFDPQGEYIKTWVPELKNIKDKFIHEPWLLKDKLKNYPEPIISHEEGRERALQSFKSLKFSHLSKIEVIENI